MPQTIMSPWAKFRTSVTSTNNPTQGCGGRVREGSTGPVPANDATDVARPDGAPPPRSSARVPRGPADPSRTRPSPPWVVLGLGPGEDELLQCGLSGPDGDGLLAQDLDHRRDRIGVVAELGEDDRPRVLHEPAAEVRRLHRVDDRVGVLEARRALEDVGDDEHAVVRVTRVRVERIAARALPVLLGH